MKKTISLILVFSLMLACCSCSKEKAQETEVSETTAPSSVISEEPAEVKPDLTFTETSINENAKWQYDAVFPDWQDRSMYGANNRLGFYGYSGQGTIYVTPKEGASDYSLYVNDIKVDTSSLSAGTTYALDISGISRNGKNSLQLSNLTSGEVEVRIPYPTVISGDLSDAGISPDAIKLIDAIISSDIEYGFTSAQVAIVRDGRLVYENSWGNVKTYDENGNSIEAPSVTNDTLYDLASVTKMYSVNYAIQYLMTNGQISLDTKIVDILGSEFSSDTIEIDYEGFDKIPLETNQQWKANLTVRDLLMHQGGFPAGPQYFNDRYDNASQSFASDNGNILYVGTSADEAARSETLKQIFKTPLMYKPGSQTLYSDLDYMILCYCIESITGQRLDEFLSKTFWEPMGLTHITYNPLQNGFDVNDCAATELMGNSRDGNVNYSGIRMNTIQGEVHDPNAYYCMAGISGHAGLFSNASDLAILASVMLTGGYGENKFFSQNVMDAFTSIQRLDNPGNGLGWQREGDHTRDYYFGSVGSSSMYGHQGFSGTLTVIDPENDMVIVILTNKIHSSILKGDPTLNSYNGNFYTTASLGFVPEIIEMGLDHDNSDSAIWSDMANDMAADYMRSIESKGITDQDHPKWKAYEAMIEAAKKVG